LVTKKVVSIKGTTFFIYELFSLSL
jgi:hypothetical protein